MGVPTGMAEGNDIAILPEYIAGTKPNKSWDRWVGSRINLRLFRGGATCSRP